MKGFNYILTFFLLLYFIIKYFKYVLCLFYLLIFLREREGNLGREREREREKETSVLLFHLCIYSLVASCMRPDQGWNLQPWCIRTML